MTQERAPEQERGVSEEREVERRVKRERSDRDRVTYVGELRFEAIKQAGQ